MSGKKKTQSSDGDEQFHHFSVIETVNDEPPLSTAIALDTRMDRRVFLFRYTASNERYRAGLAAFAAYVMKLASLQHPHCR